MSTDDDGPHPNEVFRAWLARQLDDYFAQRPETTAQDLAERIGVSAPTISRWRVGNANVSQQYQKVLFQTLGITSDILTQAGVTPPTVRTRGPARRRRAERDQAALRLQQARSAAGLPDALSGSRPGAVFALLGNCLGGAPKWLDRSIVKQRNELSRTLKSCGQGAFFCLGHEEPAVMVPPKLTRDLLCDLLERTGPTTRPSDLLLCYLWADLVRPDDELQLRFATDKGLMPVRELAKILCRSARRSLLVIEALDEEHTASAFGHDPRGAADVALDESSEQAVILAALPAIRNEVPDWLYFGQLLREGLEEGKIDFNEDGLLTVGELHRYAESKILAANRKALSQHAAGKPATLIPSPRLLYGNPNLVIGSRVE